MLFRALPLVRSRVPNAHVHVVGDGVLRGRLESLANGLGMSDAVTFHGWVDDEERNEIMRRASVFAMLSRVDALGSGEGFGIVYIEAGSLGLPVVAGRAAGAVDAVVEGVTGILVDPEDHVAGADAIVSIRSDQRLAQQMGKAGREHEQYVTRAKASGRGRKGHVLLVLAAGLTHLLRQPSVGSERDDRVSGCDVILWVDEDACFSVDDCVERARDPSRDDRKAKAPCFHVDDAEPFARAECVHPAQHREHRGAPHEVIPLDHRMPSRGR